MQGEGPAEKGGGWWEGKEEQQEEGAQGEGAAKGEEGAQGVAEREGEKRHDYAGGNSSRRNRVRGNKRL